MMIALITCGLWFAPQAGAQQEQPTDTNAGQLPSNQVPSTQVPSFVNCSTPSAIFDPACANMLSNQNSTSTVPSRTQDGEYRFDFSSDDRQERAMPQSPQFNKEPATPPVQHQTFPPEPPTDFQKFVESSLGRMLPLYGSKLFLDVPSTFAPVNNAPVPSDYVIGPGDELLLQAWGGITFNLRRIVDRSGYIYIPNVGQIQVSGLRFADAHDFLSSAIGREFQRFHLSVEMGHLRTVQIFVVGKARRPGTYTISSLSTVINALFAAGGPSASGSMRRIQLRRNSHVVAEVDLYSLLLKGDRSSDVNILPGDVIYIPPAGPRVALAGSIDDPAIYEIKPGETLGELLDMEGGLTPLASAQSAQLERIQDREGQLVKDLHLDAQGLTTKLQDGDIIWIRSLVPKFKNAVTLRGNVANPGKFPWHPGMRLLDLIPNKEALLTRQYWNQHNQLGRPSTVPAEKNSPEKLSTANNAETTSPQHLNHLAASSSYYDETTDSANKSQAPEDPHTNTVGTDVPAVDWDYAVVERLNKDNLTTSLLPFHLGRLLLQGDEKENLELRPGDVVTIFSQHDFLVPQQRQRKLVRLEGEFQAAGVYSVLPGETLRQLVERAGGLTPQAYLYGSSFSRESTRLQQQARLDDYATRLEEDIQRSAANKSGSVITPAEAAVTAVTIDSQRSLVAKLRQLKATGRIVLGIQPGAHDLSGIPDIPLEDGDAFIVPSIPSNISVIGAVYDQNSFLYNPASHTRDYLDLAGGYTRNADESRMFIIRADGSVISSHSHTSHHGSLQAAKLDPGDAIVVPERINKTTLLRGLTDWSSIFSQFALGAAAVNVIR